MMRTGSILPALVALGFLGTAGPAAAGPRYVLLIQKITSPADSLTAAHKEVVQKSLAKRIDENALLRASLPDGAPNRQKEKALKNYLKKKRLKAYDVDVYVKEFSLAEENSNGERWLVAHISMRLSGFAVPGRFISFTGKGHATVKIGVGAKVRDRDREVAIADAVASAADTALQEATTQLAQKDSAKKRRK